MAQATEEIILNAETYRAIQLSEPGKFELVEGTATAPPPGKVRIGIQACSVCHTDALEKYRKIGVFVETAPVPTPNPNPSSTARPRPPPESGQIGFVLPENRWCLPQNSLVIQTLHHSDLGSVGTRWRSLHLVPIVSSSSPGRLIRAGKWVRSSLANRSHRTLPSSSQRVRPENWVGSHPSVGIPNSPGSGFPPRA